MKQRALIFSGIAVAALFSAAGLTPWQGEQKSKTATTSSAKTQERTIRLDSNDQTYSFPNPWPAPLPHPEGSIDDVAAELASKVLAGGPDALPALERAALESGFAIHDSTGKELYKPKDNRAVGVSILDFDLAVAAELTKRKDKTLMGDLAKAAAENPALKGVPT